MERLSVSKLRANLYRIVDRVIASGQGVEIVRRGHTLRIEPATESHPVDDLRPHPEYLNADPEALVHVDWSGEWQP